MVFDTMHDYITLERHSLLIWRLSPPQRLSRQLSPRSGNSPVGVPTEVIGNSITVVHLGQEFTAKHDLTVLSVEVCDSLFYLVSCLSAGV
jgi:hypothetical protein